MSKGQHAWDAYFWEPGSPTLRNLFGERDERKLRALEYAETDKRAAQIGQGRVPVPRTYDAAHLKAIHGHLFGNVYEWAGEFRTVNMAKGGTRFAPVQDLDARLSDLNARIRRTDWSNLDHEQFADRAAATFAHLNHVHPFREGNGRTSKLFLQHVAEQSRFEVSFDDARIPKHRWNQASAESGLREGVLRWDSLTPVFRDLARPRPEAAPALDSGLHRVRGLLRATGAQREGHPAPGHHGAAPPAPTAHRATHRRELSGYER